MDSEIIAVIENSTLKTKGILVFFRGCGYDPDGACSGKGNVQVKLENI